MPQPADKRFVMEDKLTTELALKAPIADPTFTGTVTSGSGGINIPNGSILLGSGGITAASGSVVVGDSVLGSKIRGTSTSPASSADVAISSGSTSGVHIGIGNSVIAALNNTTPSQLNLNTAGGDVVIGNATTNTTLLGNFIPPRGYLLVDRLEYTSSPANFTKATYPWLRAIKVICVGAGGGGGGAALTAAGQNAIGASGSGGAYAETFITDIAGLASSVALTVGTGGTAGAAGGAGGTGGNTSFGTLCVAAGGGAGVAGAATAVGSFAAGTAAIAASSSTGDIIYPGGASSARQYVYAGSVMRPIAGNSTVSPNGIIAAVVTTTSTGTTPLGYGAGGHSGVNAASQATAVVGGAGAPGIMIVELYA